MYQKFMKKFLEILILGLSIILLNSCAKPTVVTIAMPEDNKLNCKQLKDEIHVAQRFRKEAYAAKGDTGGNLYRAALFWPAWAQSVHNADVAMKAADDRSYHLINVMKNKKCEGVDEFHALISVTSTSGNTSSIPQQLKELNALYKSGALTKKEFEKAKKKVLNR
tara:strand:- start:100 stop:594 length:495 start_codon:yes stop_codon:yes gene_type:complete